MKLLASTVEFLRCPECRGRLTVSGDTLSCGAHQFPVRDGVPRFVRDDSYVGNFSFEWQIHKRTQFDDAQRQESEETFRLKTGFTPELLRGKRVLDVGVGAGRFADVAARWGAEVVGIDLSYAVESARENLERYASAQVIQANIFSLPFTDESFDFVFSIGVLHHTPDCQGAFAALPRLVRPGGQIAIWLYNAYADNLRVNAMYRRLARQLPPRVLYGLCYLAVPGYYVYQVPVLRSLMHHLLPVVSMHSNPRWRVLDTYDWYSPLYQSRHTYREVYEWFRDAGLVDIEPLVEPVSMRARKPELAPRG
jgi:ubiquinone/menaquinone biosynthesis C-methylase UbiE